MSRKHSIVDQRPWDNLQTSASTKTTTMTTAAKLYGKDLSEYEDVDVDELLAQLTQEEINILAKEVDPDVRYNDLYGIIFPLNITLCFYFFFYCPIGPCLFVPR